MTKFRVLYAPPGRWSEGYRTGDIIDLDEAAARAALENREIERIDKLSGLETLTIESLAENKELEKYVGKKLTGEDLYRLMEICGHDANSNDSGWKEFLSKLKPFIKDLKRPLVSDKDRVEVVILITDTDRRLAEKCIHSIFRTKYPFKLTVYENSNNSRNTSKIWNKFVNESKCDYILFIDSDAYGEDDFITPMVEVLKKDKDALIVGTIGRWGVPDHQHTGYCQITKPTMVSVDMSGYCFMVKKDRLKEFGMFDEDFNFYGQDSDFTNRMQEQSRWKMYLVPNIVNHGDPDAASMAAIQHEKEGRFSISQDICYSSHLWRIKQFLRRKSRIWENLTEHQTHQTTSESDKG